MDYFQLLDLKKEPFSNSPDPEFFYGSRQHLGCLQKLELSVRLRRGLNVVVAEVGMGKTTLCRQLIRRFAQDRDVNTHLLLDPSCASAHEFLCIIAHMFGLPVSSEKDTERQLKEKIKDYLFAQGVESKKVVALIIDEGQKLPDYCVEVLREFLNYETNSNKLLQIIIFAQTEFDDTLKQHHNFADRVSMYHNLPPLSYAETKALVRFRLREAAEGVVPAIFSESGFWAVYQATGGYPRKIVELGYRVLLALILQNKKRANWRLVRSCAKRGTPIQRPAPGLSPVLLALLIIAIAVGLGTSSVDDLMGVWKKLQPRTDVQMTSISSMPVAAAPKPEPFPDVPETVPLDASQTPQEDILEKLVPQEPPVSQDGKMLFQPLPVEEPQVLGHSLEGMARKIPEPAALFPAARLTNMWGGRFSHYSQIVFWFDQDIHIEGPVVNSREAEFRFVGTISKVAPFREYSSFPGWVMLKERDGDLLARIGLPDNLEGMEHFVEHDPFRIVVNLYHN